MKRVPKKPRDPEMRNITRLDYEKTTSGWWVRFQRHNKIVAQKLFKDSDFEDNIEEALYWAKCWRDDTAAILISKNWYISPYVVKPSKRNTTNRVGVHYVDRTITRLFPNGVWYDVHINTYNASWTDISGKPMIKSFSVKMYGKRGAEEKAIEHREKQEAILRKFHKKLKLKEKS